MKDADWNRRDILKVGGAIFLPMLAAACGKKEVTCADTGGLLPAEAEMRKTLAYADASPEAGKTCSNCNFFKPAAPDACGSCTLLKGTIHPKGYCKSWAAKAT